MLDKIDRGHCRKAYFADRIRNPNLPSIQTISTPAPIMCLALTVVPQLQIFFPLMVRNIFTILIMALVGILMATFGITITRVIGGITVIAATANHYPIILLIITNSPTPQAFATLVSKLVIRELVETILRPPTLITPLQTTTLAQENLNPSILLTQKIGIFQKVSFTPLL
jgi:hypothetical protein